MAGVNRVAPIITGQSTAQTINGSLKFQSALSTYLNRTPGSTGNRRTWTWSGWVKRVKLGTQSTLMCTDIVPNEISACLDFWTDDRIRFASNEENVVVNVNLRTEALFRDTSAWYHIVFVYDSTQSTTTDRAKLYVNGVQLADWNATVFPSQNYEAGFNRQTVHEIAKRDTVYTDQYMSNVYFIDGQALGPGFFGFTDPLTGTWRPRKFEKGLATVNDGTTWTTDLTTNGGTSWFGGAAANVFDGNTGTFVQGALGGDVTFAPTTPIRVKKKLRIWADSGSGFGVGNGPYQISYNGTQIYNSSMWNSPYEITIAPGTSLSSLVLDTSAGGEAMRLFAIEVDGIIMKNATTQILEFGTNGFYLPLDNQDDYTTDKSGKGNNWTANGFTGTSSNPDVVPDSPSGVVGSTKPTSGITTTSSITKPSNYATLNPLNNGNATGTAAGGLTLSNGNLDATQPDTGNQRHIAANMAFPFPLRGKFYFEMTPGTQLTTPVTGNVGFGDYVIGGNTANSTYQNFYTRAGAFYIQGSGFVVNDAAYAFGDGDTIGCAIDFDSNIVKWYRNGSLQQSLSFPAPTVAVWPHYISVNSPVSANFGQLPFKHQPPAGFLTLCSANVRPSTVVTRPSDYVGIVTYTGNGSDGHSITGFGFSPDLLLVKARNQIYDWMMTDRCQGKGINHRTNSPNRPSADATNVTSLDSDGFTTSSGSGYMNGNNVPFVAYAWKAGGGNENGGEIWVDDVKYDSAAAAGLDGGTLTPNHASVNTKAGFSIINFIAGASNGDYTISHGMGKVPKFIILRDRTRDIGFRIYHASLDTSDPPKKYLQFTGAGAQTNTINYWGAAGAISDTTFGITTTEVLFNSANTIAYLWADVPGVQKFGSYTGNSSTDGPFIELGFRPAMVWVKTYNAVTRDWMVWDASRVPYNVNNITLSPNQGTIEATPGYQVDFLSNGFKLTASAQETNNSANSYIYCAWAEAPAHNLFGGQSLAR